MDYRKNIKDFLRLHLLGSENKEVRAKFIEATKISDESIKQYTAPSSKIAPPFEKLPEIAEFFNVTLYDLYGIKNPDNLMPEYRRLFKAMEDNPSNADLVFKMFDIVRDKN